MILSFTLPYPAVILSFTLPSPAVILSFTLPSPAVILSFALPSPAVILSDPSRPLVAFLSYLCSLPLSRVIPFDLSSIVNP